MEKFLERIRAVLAEAVVLDDEQYAALLQAVECEVTIAPDLALDWRDEEVADLVVEGTSVRRTADGR